jgi:DNA repair protein RadC
VSVGTLHTALVSIRDVLRLALTQHARGVVVFHNHPAGDTQPSDKDVAYTRRLASAAELLDIELVAHLVVAGDRYISKKYRGDF